MDENLIQFHAVEKDWLPAPYPAIQALPDWYKNLAGSVQLPGIRGTLHTVKHCPPFLDAMSSGYIIPLPGDINFSVDDTGQLTFDCPNGDISIETHDPAQIDQTPWAGAVVIKFMNPWIIVTPPGYSTLFLPPLNQESTPFEILAGVVETDTFYAATNLPAVCGLSRGSSFQMKRGTPLAQVIPIKRESWKSQIAHADAARLAEFDRDLTHSHHVYREKYHRKKSFR